MRDPQRANRTGDIFKDQIPRRGSNTDAHAPAPELLQHRDVKVETCELEPLRLCRPVAAEKVLERIHSLHGILMAIRFSAAFPEVNTTVAPESCIMNLTRSAGAPGSSAT
ncbi:hypothetical protein V491_08492, partial [Pseudogymnoascus sp. VKM F-3775]